jgi:hypothetical protein
MFAGKVEAKPYEAGNLIPHIIEMGSKGMRMIACYPKIEMPKMPGMGELLKGNVTVESKLDTFFTPHTGDAIATTSAFTTMNSATVSGFTSFTKIDIEENMNSTISAFVADGWSVAGL